MGILEKIEKERKDKILKEKETFQEYNLYCPWCGEQQCLEGKGHEDMDTEIEDECLFCGKLYYWRYEYVFSSNRKAEKEQ